MNENKKFSISNMMLAFITVLVVIGLVALTGFFLLTPPDDIIMGQAEANQVRISGKVPGRIEMYRFDEGDKVKAGDTLVYLNTPEVLAKLQQAEAVQKAAEAQNAKALKGARAQEIAGAYEMWQKAQAGLEIAKKSYTRVQNLYDKGVMSAQKRDEAEANYKAMVATEKAAKSQYDMARDGARSEDKAGSTGRRRCCRSGILFERVGFGFTYRRRGIRTFPTSGRVGRYRCANYEYYGFERYVGIIQCS